MKTWMIAMLGALLVSAGFANAQASAPSADGGMTGVYHFTSTRAGGFQNKPCLLAFAAPANGGAVVEFVIPNSVPTDAKDKKKVEPDPVIAGPFKAAKPGDPLEITFQNVQGKSVVRSVKPYVLTPGEDEKDVYIFTEKTTAKAGTEDVPAVTVQKYLQPFTFIIASKKDSDGKSVADADQTKVIDALIKGDTVEIQGTRQGANVVISSIRVYTVPKLYTFSKVVKQKVGAVDMAAVEVNSGDNSQVFLVDPKGKDAAAIMAVVTRLKASQSVLIRSTSDDRGSWMIAIKAAPEDKPNVAPPAAPNPAPKHGGKPNTPNMPHGGFPGGGEVPNPANGI